MWSLVARMSVTVSSVSDCTAAMSASTSAAACCLLREVLDLVGDDGEALAVLAGAGGLDVGVEREQVRLLGDLRDDVDDSPMSSIRSERENRSTASAERDSMPAMRQWLTRRLPGPFRHGRRLHGRLCDRRR